MTDPEKHDRALVKMFAIGCVTFVTIAVCAAIVGVARARVQQSIVEKGCPTK